MQRRQISTTARPILFFMTDSADSRTGKTGLTPTVTISKNGAAFGAAAGAVSEIGNGWYALAGNATDRGTLGPLALHATASGADPSDLLAEVVTYDPFGLSLSDKIAEGDETVDKGGSPWEQVIKEKGTSTELVRKRMYESDGTTPITSDDQIVGTRIE